ncbi:MAG TPA: hypothetical protein VHB97_05045, partial [Polyangia bacterium]|nr:hypothetical protein [Polyangia bacterium]
NGAPTHAAPPRSDGGHAARATVILSAPWGGGAGQLGHRTDPESVTEGPMSFVVDARGAAVLDNVNRRVARFDAHGRALAPIALDTDAAQDLARMHDRLAVLDRLHDKRITIYDADGKPNAVVSLAAAGFSDAAAVTGIFGDRDGALWGEREHGAWLRLTDADGMPDATHLPAPGRPTRAGSFVSAAIADRAAGRARVALFATIDNTPAWQTTVDFGAPLLFLVLVDADASGRVYVAAHTGRESPAPPYAVSDESLTVIALGSDGSEAGRITLPAPPPREESFRDLYVGDDGTIYWMRRTATGVVVEAYRI